MTLDGVAALASSALETGDFTPATYLHDEPVTLKLPNGDIWIHRNTPLFAPSDSAPGPNGEIEL